MFDPNTYIELWFFIAIFSILIYLFLIFLTISHKFYLEQKNILPKIISIFQKEEDVVILAEPSKLFSENIFVSYYSKKDGFEIFVGYGRVTNIQEDKKIQISILKFEDESLLEGLKNNNVNIIKKIILKPYMPSDLLMVSKW